MRRRDVLRTNKPPTATEDALMPWPRRANAPAVTVNDRGNDAYTLIACPTCAYWEAKLIPTARELNGPGQAGMVRYTNRVACPHCDA